jgi:hypothetical protein
MLHSSRSRVGLPAYPPYQFCLCPTQRRPPITAASSLGRNAPKRALPAVQGDGRYCVGNFYANLDCGTGLPSPERRCCGRRWTRAWGVPAHLAPCGPGSLSSVTPKGPGLFSRHSSRPITAGIAKKPEPPKPITWNVCKIASKAVWLGASLPRCSAKRRRIVQAPRGPSPNMTTTTASTPLIPLTAVR